MDLATKLKAFRLDDTQLARLRNFSSTVEQHADGVLDRFYSFFPNLTGGDRFFENQAAIDRAKAAQKRHWLALFRDGLNEATAQTGIHIGQVHARIGVTPSWYIAGYTFVINELMALAQKSGGRFGKGVDTASAVQSMLLLDMELALSAYIGAENESKAVQAARHFSETMIDGTVGLSVSVNEAAISNAEMMKSLRDVNHQAQTVAAGVDQMVSSIQAINQSTQQAADISRHTASTASDGERVVSDAVAKMEQIAQVVTQSADQAEALAAASAQISDIVETIEDIASQTNLLALNATIEAARAGEAGKGFAVVANEVKNLSSQTSNATEEIRGRIESVTSEMKAIVDAMQNARSAVEAGTGVMQQVSEQMGEIGTRVQELDQRTDEISNILNEQTQASTEVAEGVATIAQAATTNVDKTVNAAGTMRDVETMIGNQMQSLMAHDIPHKIVKIAKSDHVIWKKRLADMMVGLETLDPDELADHTSCRLGKWYYSPDAASYQGHPAYKRLEEPHRLVHKHGIEAARLFRAGSGEAAMREIAEVAEASKQVIACLDELAASPFEERLAAQAAF